MLGFLDRLKGSSHRLCQGNLSAYIDGELSPRDRERVRRHLEQCGSCRRELDALEQTVALLRRLPQAKAPRSFRIPHSTPAPTLPVWMRPWAYSALCTATAAAAILFVVTMAGNALAAPPFAKMAAPSAAPMEAAEQAPGALEYGRLTVGAPATSAAPEAAPLVQCPGPAEEPTLTPEEEARRRAAPEGKGGGAEELATTPVSVGEAPATEPALSAMNVPTQQPEIAAEPAEPTVAAAAREGGARTDLGRGGAPQVPDRFMSARLELARYPWRLWAAAMAVLLAALAAGTLWLRAARARWP